MDRPKHISDAELLSWIADGSLAVGLDNPSTIENNGRSVKCYETGNSPGLSAGAHTRFSFAIRRDGRRRTIVRSKLVYLAGARSPVPDGFEIHHLDLDRYNDAWENLIALSSDDHDKLHGWISQKETEDFVNGF